MREINCLRCGVPMKHYLTERIQLGGESIFLPHLDNLLSGYLPVSIMKKQEVKTFIERAYCDDCGVELEMQPFVIDTYPPIYTYKCPKCRKLEFFLCKSSRKKKR